jgi:RNA polymerase sigma-54 factor
MSQSIALKQQQSQHLTMTPELKHSIEMLQMSAMDLVSFVQEEMAKNPLLVESDAGGGEEEVASSVADERQQATEGEEPFSNADTLAESESSTVPLHHYTPQNGNSGQEHSDPLDMMASSVTLREYLWAQIVCDIPAGKERKIAEQLLDTMDENGYLKEEWHYVAKQVGCTAGEVESVLVRLQRCDPAGVFARSLKECLRLQLQEQLLIQPAYAVLLEHLDLVAAGDMGALARHCRVKPETLHAMVRQLQTLNPKPGAGLGSEQVSTVPPDVFVRRGKERSLRVELNMAMLPRVLLDRHYYHEISQHSHGQEEKKYLSQQWMHANWLLRALDQRAETMLKVAVAITEWQKSFFEAGLEFMRPMTLKDIASQLGIHESTVSRVAANKVMATPLGTFPFKYFFMQGVENQESGGQTSSHFIKQRLKQCIEAEGDTILSDEDIVSLLGKEGIVIARRTVAKYREAFGIPSSSIRRRKKRIAS